MGGIFRLKVICHYCNLVCVLAESRTTLKENVSKCVNVSCKVTAQFKRLARISGKQNADYG